MSNNDDRLTLYTQDGSGRLWSLDMSSFDDGELRFITRSLRAMTPRQSSQQRRSNAMSTVVSMAALAMVPYVNSALSAGGGLFNPPIRGGRRK